MLKSKVTSSTEKESEDFPQLRQVRASGNVYLFETPSSKGFCVNGSKIGQSGVFIESTSPWYGEITLKQE